MALAKCRRARHRSAREPRQVPSRAYLNRAVPSDAEQHPWRVTLHRIPLGDTHHDRYAHEHISDMAAVLMAEELVHRTGGVLVIEQIILDDILKAREAHDFKQAERWYKVLEHFVAAHPENTM